MATRKVDTASLSRRARITLPDGSVAIESEGSRILRVVRTWEALPDDHDTEIDGDPFDAPAPR